MDRYVDDRRDRAPFVPCRCRLDIVKMVFLTWHDEFCIHYFIWFCEVV